MAKPVKVRTSSGEWADLAVQVPSANDPTFTGTTSSSTFNSTQSSGDEGGEVKFAKAATNTTLNTGVTLDVYQDKVRLFETAGTNRGGYFDMSTLSTGVGTNLAPGLTHINTTTLTGTSANVNILNVFSSLYKNYKVMLNLSTSSADNPHIRFGVSGTPDSTSGNYRHAGFYSYYGYSGTGTFYSGGSGTGINVGAISTAGQLYGASLDIYNPNEAQYTNLTGLYHDNAGYSYYTGGVARTSTQYTDLYIYTSNNITGTINIYGYR